jgi:endonuclease/exonuclease/phosphatase family metal-dependent hydrolase
MYEDLMNDLRSHGKQWLLTALVTVFGMQILRVLFVSFVGYLRDSQGMASLTLAPIAIGIFALSFLAGPLNRFAGTRTALWVTAGGLALVRLAEQFAQNAQLDLYLSSLGTALFLMYLPIAIGITRKQGEQSGNHFGLAFLLGFSLDSAIQIGARTLDISWQPGLTPIVLIIIMALAILWALSGTKADTETVDASWNNSINLLAIGPFIFLQLLIFQNVAAFSSLTGWETPAAGALLIAGNVIGLVQASRVASQPRNWTYSAISGLMLAVPTYMAFSATPFLVGVWLVIGQVFSFTMGMLLIQGVNDGSGKPGLLRLTVMNGLSSVLLVLFLFLYYASYDINFGFRSGALRLVAVVIITICVAAGHLRTSSAKKRFEPTYSPALLAAIMLIIPLALLPSWKAVAAQPAETGTTSVRIMDYNLHDAVNTDGHVDPEALAQVIEQSGADIVGLQEISRGWLVWGGMDMLTWLTQRLDMPYVWGPTADEQWGNAILSRYPITKVEFYDLPPEDVLLLRGFIWAEIDIDDSTLTIIDTHYSERDDQDEIRAIQSSAILSTWNNQPATVIMGDLNSLPDSQAVTLILDAGLIDVSREIGQQPTFTYSSFHPDHQIDYIFVTPDLGFIDFVIPDTQASDHLPLATTIELP